MTTLPRRAFLLNALAVCGAPFIRTERTRAGQLSVPQADLARGAQTATSYFGAAGIAREIGEEFLEQVGADGRPESIQAAAAGALKLISAGQTRQAALTSLVRAVRSDFRDGRTVELHGWVLSRTEAELCALTLLASKPGK
jgi:hypothetical protein